MSENTNKGKIVGAVAAVAAVAGAAVFLTKTETGKKLVEAGTEKAKAFGETVTTKAGEIADSVVEKSCTTLANGVGKVQDGLGQLKEKLERKPAEETVTSTPVEEVVTEKPEGKVSKHTDGLVALKEMGSKGNHAYGKKEGKIESRLAKDDFFCIFYKIIIKKLMNKYLAYLHSIGFSQRNLKSIFENSNDYKGFFESLNHKKLLDLKIKEEKIFELMENYKKADYKKIDNILAKNNVELISFCDLLYPELLKNIPNPPFLLYVRGKLQNIDLLSIVGSRKNTRYSQIVLEKFIPELINNSFGIVSGGAFGVDSLAHSITLKNNGYTIAIIGTGIDSDYPSSNKSLYKNIEESNGAVLSIFRLGTGPDKYNFPIRNEIIAGLSKGTLVTEAGEKSGTLITANLALDFGRDVFVVPGDITKETSYGANKLIKTGAGKLVTQIEDILEEYNINYSFNKEIQQIDFSDEIEKLIYESLKISTQDISSLSDKLNIDVEIIAYKLSIMEISGYIELSNSGLYNIV